jgi:hypothetical protein
MTDASDQGVRVRVSMTFSEQAHPAFVETLRGLSCRARSRLIHALVERGLAVSIVAAARPAPDAVALPARKHGGASDAAPPSPLDGLGSTGSLFGSDELGT